MKKGRLSVALSFLKVKIMRKIDITEAPLTLYTGRLKLTEDQAIIRIHNLVDLGGGLFDIKNPVQFKIGEIIYFNGDLPKGVKASFEPDEPPVIKKKKAVKKKAKRVNK